MLQDFSQNKQKIWFQLTLNKTFCPLEYLSATNN